MEKPNKEWDNLLNLLMDKGEVTDVSEYHLTFNGKYKVWITNHPYASGSINKRCFDEMLKDDNFSSLLCEYHCRKETKIRLEDFYYSRKLTNDGSDIIAKHAIEIASPQVEQLNNYYI
jgi:hypothetical protein